MRDPVFASASAARPDAALDALPPGTSVGAYRVVRLLGVGGMGVVYEAEQDLPRRRVALKLLSGGGATWPQSLRRFVAEAEALAQLEHPAIVRLYHTGKSDAGVLFLAMELVDGVPLDDYLAQQRLDLPARLRLLGDVLAAVAHAHERGVLHLDLKPGNVLVEAGGRVRVVDFGLARLADRDPRRREVVGTLPYMAPEQRRGRALSVRTDVHALGAVLAELLDDGTAAPDLQAIVRVATAARPEQRYASVAALAADVRRYLGREPVAAHRGGAGYRFAKLVDRRPRLVALAVGVLVFALGCFAVTLATLRDAVAARDLARRGEAQASATAAVLEEILQAIGPRLRDRGEDLPALTAGLLERHASGDPATRAALSAAAGRACLDLGAFEVARQHLELALRLRRELLRAPHPTLATSLRDLGFLLHSVRELDAAEPLLRQALAMREVTLASHSPEVLQSRTELAELLFARGASDAALALSHRAVVELRAARPQPETLLADALTDLGWRLQLAGRPSEAVPVLEQAHRLRQALPPDAAARVRTWRMLGRAHQQAGQVERAQRTLAECQAFAEAELGARHPELAWAWEFAGQAARVAGDGELALASLDRALAIRQAQLGEQHPLVVATLQQRAGMVTTFVGAEAGRRALAELWSLVREAYGPEDRQLLRIGLALAAACRGAGDDEAARAALAEVDRLLAVHPSDIDTRLVALHQRGALLAAQDPRAALPWYRQALELARAHLGAESHQVGTSFEAIAACHARLGGLRQAVAAGLEACAAHAGAGAAAHAARMRVAVGEWLADLGERAAAAAQLTAARQELGALGALQDRDARRIEVALARAEQR